MPRDSRLYMTFPIDFHRHPKITRLPADVRWTFVEMNGEARLAENDGRFTIEEAEFQWPVEHLDALTRSHPTRPLVLREGDHYVIRDYAQHQFTKADREDLSRKRSEAGQLGAAAKAANREANAKQVLSKLQQTQAESESESESGLDDYYKTSKSQSSSNRARGSTDSLSPTLQTLANQAGLRNIETIRDEIRARTGCDITLDRTVGVARHLLEKAPTGVRNAQAYVLTCVRETPAEIEQHIYST